MKTFFNLFLMAVVLAGMLITFPPTPPAKPEPKGLVIAGTDLFWETYEAEYHSCPDEARAAELLRAKGYQVYE